MTALNNSLFVRACALVCLPSVLLGHQRTVVGLRRVMYCEDGSRERRRCDSACALPRHGGDGAEHERWDTELDACV